MGMANLDQIVAGLGRAGLRGDTPAAVIERGFSDSPAQPLTTPAADLTGHGSPAGRQLTRGGDHR